MSDQAASDEKDGVFFSVEELQRLREQVSVLQEENQRLRGLSHEDDLTQLANRRYYEERLREAFSLRRRQSGALSLLAIDLDNFKPINDSLGHAAGDLALRSVAAVLRASIRCSDLAARLGGDEFGVILPATTRGGAIVVAERIRAQIEALELGRGARLTASIGVATVGEGDPVLLVETLCSAADLAMYAAKQRKNSVHAAH